MGVLRASTRCALVLFIALLPPRAWADPPQGSSSLNPGFGEEEDEDLPEGDAPTNDEPEPDAEPEVGSPPSSTTLEPALAVPPPPPAEAAEPPPPPSPEPSVQGGLLVLVLPTAEGTFGLAQHIGERTTTMLAAKKDLAPRTLEGLVDPQAEGEIAERIRAGVDGVEAGQGAIDDLDLESAGATLEDAVNGLIAHLGRLDPEARAALDRGIFAYAAATLFEGNTDQADAIFVALVLLDPSFQPDATRFPSNVVGRFKDVRSKLDTRPTGALSIKTSPVGAAISVDGAFRGYGPLEVGGLADGFHAVVAERALSRPVGTLAPVTGERTATLDLELEAGPGHDLLDRLAPGMATDERRAVSLGAELGVERLLVVRLDVRLSGNQATGLWLDVPNRKVIGKIGPLPLSTDPDVAAQTLAQAVDVATAPVVVAPASLVADAPSEGPAWWVWVVIGGVVVAAGAGAVVLASRDGGPPNNTAIFGF